MDAPAASAALAARRRVRRADGRARKLAGGAAPRKATDDHMRMVRASAHGKFEGGVLSKAEWQGVMRSTLHGSIYEQQRSGADVIAFGELDQAIIDAVS